VSSHRRLPLLPTTVVGSYPQPDWLVDREKLIGRGLPPRVRMREVWRIPEPYLEAAQDDATVLAIRDLERAGIDIVTDGEMRRESYSNHFSNVLDGIDVDNPAHGLSRRGRPDLLPRVVGPIRRRHAVEVRDVQLLRASTDRTIKFTVPGPFTMSQQAVDEYYGDPARLALDPVASPVGAAVRFRNNKAVAVFTLGATLGWRTTEGLKVADPSNRVAELYGEPTYKNCIGYQAFSLRGGANVTTIYLTSGVVYGFALTSPGLPVCQ